MDNNAAFWRHPRLRKGVTLSFTEAGADLTYRKQGCFLTWPDSARSDAERFFTDLKQGSKSVAELIDASPSLGNIPALLIELDRLGLLTETYPREPPKGCAGLTFYSELCQFVESASAIACRSAFNLAMTSEQVTERQLIGYAIEYYHIVNLCPSLLLPLLSASLDTPSRMTVERFIVSELPHTNYLASALASVGVTKSQLAMTQPLPCTFALCSTLGVWAAQDTLSLRACLFILETPQPDFNAAFMHSCKRLGLPSAFYDPIVEHSGVNDMEKHDDISLRLMAEVPFVSPEEQIRIRKNTVFLLETLGGLESEILLYYGTPTTIVPRIFHREAPYGTVDVR